VRREVDRLRVFHDVWWTYVRHTRASLRQPVWMFFSMIQPMIWLVLFTQLFASVASVPGFPAEVYLQFFVPGLIVMLAVFSPAYSGFEMLSDIYHGVLEKVLVTPVNRYALIVGAAIDWAVQLAGQVLIVFGLSYFMGVRVATGLLGVLLTIMLVVLLGLGFFGLSNALVLVTRREEPLVVVGNLMTLPLMFLSSVMMPSQLAPGWMRVAMMFNPVNWAVEAVRPLFFGWYSWPQILASLMVLGVFAVVGVSLASLALRRFGD